MTVDEYIRYTAPLPLPIGGKCLDTDRTTSPFQNLIMERAKQQAMNAQQVKNMAQTPLIGGGPSLVPQPESTTNRYKRELIEELEKLSALISGLPVRFDYVLGPEPDSVPIAKAPEPVMSCNFHEFLNDLRIRVLELQNKVGSVLDRCQL